MKHTDAPCILCIQTDLHVLVAARAASLGLEIAGSLYGEHVEFPDGRRLRVDLTPDPDGSLHWREVELEREVILRAATEMIEAFAAKHGAGKIWTLLGLPLVHIVNDDGNVVRDGKIRLRRFIAHESTAVAP